MSDAGRDSAHLLEALRENEEFKTRLLESSRDCIKVLDLDGRLLSMNAGGMEVLEICDLGPYLHGSWIDFWQGEDRERAREAVERARAGGLGRFVGFFPTTQTGRPLWFDVVVNAILDAAGRPEKLLAVSRDVTDLKRAEDVLRLAHDQLEIEVRRRTADLARAHAALEEEMQQRQRAAAMLRGIVEGVESETGDRFFLSLVRHLAGSLAVQYAFVSQLGDDRLRFRTLAVWGRGARLENFELPLAGTPCEAVLAGASAHHPRGIQALFPADTGLATWGVESYAGVPLLDAAGEVVGHLAILDDRPMADGERDLSILRIFAARARAELERLGVEAALRESEARLAAVIDSALDAIVTVDGAGRVLLFNGAAEKVFRRTAAEVIGRPLALHLSPGLEQALAAAMRAEAEGAGVRQYISAADGASARRADGTEFSIEATLSRAELGGRPLYTLILRDVDERRRAEAELRRLSEQNAYLQDEILAVHNAGDVIGTSAALRGMLDKVRLVAGTDSSVLILGETGSGKELVARAVHAASRRSGRPLIKVNCAALPTGLIESELFGHERGAFTGATDRRVGRFELAAGGTIFLDEIGDMPHEVQAKLLRVLQEREFERVGGSKTITVDVRVIAATNRDLAAAVAEGKFRQDLFYRLNVFPIEVPPLRARAEDIPLLVHFFVGRYAQKIGRQITHVPHELMRRLQAYGWPGNVRELENVIERAVILSPGPGLEISTGLLPVAPAPRLEPVPAVQTAAAAAPMRAVERDHIARVLRQTRWRIEGAEGAAQQLGLKPSTLRSRIKKLGIRRSDEIG